MKESEWSGCIVWVCAGWKPPGLVGAIVMIFRETASLYWHYTPKQKKSCYSKGSLYHTVRFILICHYRYTGGGIVLQPWCNPSSKAHYKRLRTVAERRLAQAHCDLCAKVFPMCFSYIKRRGQSLSISETWPGLRSYSGARRIYVGWQRGIHLQPIPLLLNCRLLSLTLSPNPHKETAFCQKHL